MRGSAYLKLPKELIEMFDKEASIVRIEPAPGYWPLEMSTLRALEKLYRNPEFAEKWEIIITPKHV